MVVTVVAVVLLGNGRGSGGKVGGSGGCDGVVGVVDSWCCWLLVVMVVAVVVGSWCLSFFPVPSFVFCVFFFA